MTEGKGRYDLIPALALMRIAKRMEIGAQKHGSRGWLTFAVRTGERYCKVMRHLAQHVLGMRDEDHLAAAGAQLMIWLDIDERVLMGKLPPACDDATEYAVVN